MPDKLIMSEGLFLSKKQEYEQRCNLDKETLQLINYD